MDSARPPEIGSPKAKSTRLRLLSGTFTPSATREAALRHIRERAAFGGVAHRLAARFTFKRLFNRPHETLPRGIAALGKADDRTHRSRNDYAPCDRSVRRGRRRTSDRDEDPAQPGNQPPEECTNNDVRRIMQA